MSEVESSGRLPPDVPRYASEKKTQRPLWGRHATMLKRRTLHKHKSDRAVGGVPHLSCGFRRSTNKPSVCAIGKPSPIAVRLPNTGETAKLRTIAKLRDQRQ